MTHRRLRNGLFVLVLVSISVLASALIYAPASVRAAPQGNLSILGTDTAQHTTTAIEEDLGSVALGVDLDKFITVQAGGQYSGPWSIDYVSGYSSDGTLSPLSTLTPSSGNLPKNGAASVELRIHTGTLSPGAIYHGELQALGSGVSGVYYFKFTTFDFSLSASPLDITVLKGGSASYTVTVTTTAGSGQPVSLSVSGLPSGATSSFTTNPVTPTGSTALTVNTSAAGGLGDFTLTVTGTSGSLSHTTTVRIHSYDFAVSSTPSTVTVLRGGTVTYAVSLSLTPSSSTFNLPNIALSVSSLPPGVTSSFSPASGTPPFNSTLTLFTSGTASLGDSSFTVTGTDGRTPQGGSHVSSASNLHIFDYTVSISGFPDQTLLRGSSPSYTVTITLLTGSTTTGIPGNVSLTLNGPPNGAVITLQSSIPFPTTTGAAGATTTTLSLGTSSAALGDFSLSVTGTVSGGARASNSVILRLFDYSVSVSPSDRTILRAGSSASYSVTISLATGSTSTGLPVNIGLSVTGVPSGSTTTLPSSVSFPQTAATPTTTTLTVTTSDSTSLGDFALAVTGSVSSGSRSGSAGLHIFDFTVSLSPSDATLLRGVSASYTVTVNLSSGSTTTGLPTSISLSLTGAPAGSTTILSGSVSFPQSVSGPTTTTLSIGTTSSTVLGDSTLTVTGTIAAGTRSGSAGLHIFDYTVSVTPSDITILSGNSASYSVTITLMAGSTTTGLPTTLFLSVTGAPTGSTVSLVSSAAFPSLGSPTITTLIVATGSGTTLGDFSLTLVGTISMGSHFASANLHIFDYTVSLSPSDITMLRGRSTSYTITVNLAPGSSTTGLPSTLSLSLSGAPGDAATTLATSVSFPQNAGTPTTTILSVTSGATSLGDFTLTVTGFITSGSRNGSAGLHLYDFTVTISPSDATMLRGGTTAYTVTLSLTLGSSVPPAISLSFTGLPSDATVTLAASLTPNMAGASTSLMILTASGGLASLGSFPFTVIGTDRVNASGGSRSSSGSSLHIYDFTVEVSPSDRTIPKGALGTYTVTVTLAAGSSTPPAIDLTTLGLPSDASALFTSSSLTPSSAGTSTTLTITSGASALGDFSFSVYGTDNVNPNGGFRVSGTANLHIFDYTIVISPPAITVLRGGSTSASYTVTISLTNGSTTTNLPSAVSLILTGAPSDGSIALAASVTFPTNTGTHVTTSLTIAAGASSLGDFTFTVTGTVTGGSRQGSARLHIFDFNVILSPSDRTVLRGASTTYTVGVNLVPGSTSTDLPASILIALSGLPSDALTNGNTVSLGLGASATFTVQTGSSSLGDFTLTATGFVNGGSRSSSAGLHVFDYTINVSPTDRTVLRGGSTSYAITISLTAGSTTMGLPGTLLLSLASAPSDATINLQSLQVFPQDTGTLITTALNMQTGGTSLGDFALAVIGAVSDGSRSRTTNLHLYDYTLGLGPLDRTILRSNSTTYTVTVNLVTGSSTTNLPSIYLSISGLPADATFTFSLGSGTPGFTSLLNVTTAPGPSGSLGDFSLNVRGADIRTPEGGFRVSNIAALHIYDYVVTVNITLNQFTTGTSISSSNYFTVNYILGGTSRTALQVGGTLSIIVDTSTNVTIAGISSGSSGSEHWCLYLCGAVTFNATNGVSQSYYYYDQLLLPLQYGVVGGSPPSLPTATFTYYGSSSSVTSFPVSRWIDVGSSVVWSPNPLTGSTSSVRWEAPQTSFTVISPASVDPTYFKQFAVDASFTTSDSSAPSSTVVLTGTQFAVQLVRTTLNSTPQSTWLDAQTSWLVNSPILASLGRERWNTLQATSGTVISSMTISFLYYHQYLWTLSYSVTAGVSGYSGPTFNATSFGIPSSQALTATPTSYWFDAGSSWSVTNPLGGSSGAERWQTNQAVSGTISVGPTVNFAYYHQYLLTFSYSVRDSSVPTLAPVFIANQFGASENATLTLTPSTTWFDAGSWSVSNPITASSGKERWSLTPSQLSSGSTLPSSVVFVYFHQFEMTLSYALVAPAGTGYSAPTFVADQFGLAVGQTLTNMLATYWIDAGSWNVTISLTGSTPGERWILVPSQSSGGTVSTRTINFAYYHQFLFTLSQSIIGGGSPSTPVITTSQYGSTFSQVLTATPTAYFFDAGSQWSITNPLGGSTASERWQTDKVTSGTVSGAQTFSLVYYHQFQVALAVSPTAGGSTSPAGSGWYNNGESISIIASAQAGFAFAGWSVDSSSITLASSSAASTAALIRGPGTIIASFTNSISNITVAFQIPSLNGGNITCNGANYFDGQSLQLPPNSTLTCRADAPPGYTFSGWSGLASGNSNLVTFSVGNGGVLTASFTRSSSPPSPSSPLISGTLLLAILIAAIALASIGILYRRYKQGSSQQGSHEQGNSEDFSD